MLNHSFFNPALTTTHNPQQVQIALARITYLYPIEFRLATGKLIKILSESPEGIEKAELLQLYYPDFQHASFSRQMSLETCLNKIIQRARARYTSFGLNIHFCKRTRRWMIIAKEIFTEPSNPFPVSHSFQAL